MRYPSPFLSAAEASALHAILGIPTPQVGSRRLDGGRVQSRRVRLSTAVGATVPAPTASSQGVEG